MGYCKAYIEVRKKMWLIFSYDFIVLYFALHPFFLGKYAGMHAERNHKLHLKNFK